jgi:hypothetical protein
MVLRAILIAILFTVLPFGRVANAGPPLPQVLITSVYLFFPIALLTIKGQNFDGGSPVVTLGDDPVPLEVISTTATQIVVKYPPDKDGDFRLTVSTGPANKDSATYDLTIPSVTDCTLQNCDGPI